MTTTTEYSYLLRPNRPDFITTMTEAEQAVMGEHFVYLQQLLSAGQLILAGPCLDAAYGVVIFRADSPEAAAAIMQNDPAVVKAVMSAEVHPFRVSLMEGRDDR
ncbi:hypothetical protein CIG75_03795 [Tumebacillus algifaecis]|uniref:YCII-related domain-containing protein n=1 Tax=Tumebacillus algifaecis TaxID=1214604 RepID=A0A223CYJ2_9BACL|nr:YciI family protein [Tumebacillus algifaecis]ASS74193.1 hypothetical protein CIG75_03795 [Tumebacillus algifaecis]